MNKNEKSNLKNNFIIRCDASLLIGNGHVVRCRSLARYLRKRSINSIFFCRALDGNLIKLIEDEFQTIVLEKPKNKERFYSSNYCEMLGVKQEIDAKEVIYEIEKNKIGNISGFIVDHYSLDYIWQNFIKNNIREDFINKDYKITVIDDLHNRKHNCDNLIDQNFTSFKSIDNYKNLVPSECIKLLGPTYCLLDEVYYDLYFKSRIRTSIKKIMIYFGGNDNKNYTYKLVKLFSNKKYKNFLIEVVISKSNKFYSEILKITQSLNNCNVFDSLVNLATLIFSSDLAIGAGGTTTWERLALGLPSLIIPVADNQIEGSLNLERKGLIKVIEDNQKFENWIEKSIEEFNNNLFSFSEKSKFVVDPFGSARVCNLLTSTERPIKLKNLESFHKEILFKLSNDADTRNNSFKKEEISIEEHNKWFEKVVSGGKSIIYIAYCNNDIPIGQIRFDIKQNNLYLNFSIEKTSRGKGFGYEIINQSLKKLKEESYSFNLIIADVFSENLSSINIFRKLSFLEDEMKKSKVIRFTKKFRDN